MDGFNNDDVKKMLEMLKEQAESNSEAEINIDAQTTDNIHTDEDIQNMLKQQFASEQGDNSVSVVEDYSFDSVDEFMKNSKTEEIPLGFEFQDEIKVEKKEISDEESEFSFIVAKIPNETSEIVLDNPSDKLTVEESIEKVEELVVEVEEIEINQNDESHNFVEEDVQMLIKDISFDSEQKIETDDEVSEKYIEDCVDSEEIEAREVVQSEDEEPISEESINYEEILEGQQGTVFNEFVEDFTGDLDDVVFEAEITCANFSFP